MSARYRVTLTDVERHDLRELVSGGKARVRRVKRAQILLAADRGETEAAIATSVAAGTSTVYRTKRRFVEQGLEAALAEEPKQGATRKLSAREEVLLVAVACSDPPAGRARWTLQLLADEMVTRTDHDEVSRETIRRRLGEQEVKPWRQKMWCIPKVDTEYVARMEDVLDLYTQPAEPKCPVVCFDETPVQLIGETRQPWPAKPGTLRRIDYEYRRNGTATLFVFLNAHKPSALYRLTSRTWHARYCGVSSSISCPSTRAG